MYIFGNVSQSSKEVIKTRTRTTLEKLRELISLQCNLEQMLLTSVMVQCEMWGWVNDKISEDQINQKIIINLQLPYLVHSDYDNLPIEINDKAISESCF